MPIWFVQTAAIVLALVVLGFFAFASAYYARNRRIALAARDVARRESGQGVEGGPLSSEVGTDPSGSDPRSPSPDVE